MEITLNDLLRGNATVIKKKEYLSTQEYVNPFLDSMAKYTDEFVVQVQMADQMSLDTDYNKANVIYNRVLIQAILPEKHCIDNHDEVIGFLYGLDIRKPVAKIYRGYLNRACTNLCVFSPEWIKYQEIEPQKGLEYDVTDLMEATNNIKLKLDQMKQEFLPTESKKDNLGKWIDFSLHQFNHNGIHSTKISPSMVIDSYKSVYYDDSSPYYVGEHEESSLFNIYNAFTQTLTDDKKDIMNKFEKTLLINRMLGL